MLVRTLIWASLVPYYQYSCQGLAPAWMGRIGIRQTSQSPATSTTPLVVKETQKTKSSNRRSIRIRSTQTADLADVAKMLSTAAINPESSASDPWNWKTNMDRLLAKADIEAFGQLSRGLSSNSSTTTLGERSVPGTRAQGKSRDWGIQCMAQSQFCLGS
jgi:hypothetical protein